MFHRRVLFVSALLETAFRPSRVVDLAGFVGSCGLPASATLLELFPLWLSSCQRMMSVRQRTMETVETMETEGVWARRSGWESESWEQARGRRLTRDADMVPNFGKGLFHVWDTGTGLGRTGWGALMEEMRGHSNGSRERVKINKQSECVYNDRQRAKALEQRDYRLTDRLPPATLTA